MPRRAVEELTGAGAGPWPMHLAARPVIKGRRRTVVASRRASHANGDAAKAPHASPRPSASIMPAHLPRTIARIHRTPSTSSTTPPNAQRATGVRCRRARASSGDRSPRSSTGTRAARRRSPTPSNEPAPRAHGPRPPLRGGRATTTPSASSESAARPPTAVLNANAPAVASTPAPGRSRAHSRSASGKRCAEADAVVEALEIGRERAPAFGDRDEPGGNGAARA